LEWNSVAGEGASQLLKPDAWKREELSGLEQSSCELCVEVSKLLSLWEIGTVRGDSVKALTRLDWQCRTWKRCEVEDNDVPDVVAVRWGTVFSLAVDGTGGKTNERGNGGGGEDRPPHWADQSRDNQSTACLILFGFQDDAIEERNRWEKISESDEERIAVGAAKVVPGRGSKGIRPGGSWDRGSRPEVIELVVDVVSEPVHNRGTIELPREIENNLPRIWQEKSAVGVSQEFSRESVAARLDHVITGSPSRSQEDTVERAEEPYSESRELKLCAGRRASLWQAESRETISYVENCFVLYNGEEGFKRLKKTFGFTLDLDDGLVWVPVSTGAELFPHVVGEVTNYTAPAVYARISLHVDLNDAAAQTVKFENLLRFERWHGSLVAGHRGEGSSPMLQFFQNRGGNRDKCVPFGVGIWVADEGVECAGKQTYAKEAWRKPDKSAAELGEQAACTNLGIDDWFDQG